MSVLGRETPRGDSGDPLAWKAKGACHNYPPNAFFPSDAKGVKAAQEICKFCSIKTECLEYALANREDFGVWGGKSERERRRILKRQRLEAQAE